MVIVLPDGEKGARRHGENDAPGRGLENHPARPLLEKMDAREQKEDRNPEGPQAEKADEDPRHMGADHAEEVMNLLAGGGVVDGRVGGMIGGQADEGKRHQEKQKDAVEVLADVGALLRRGLGGRFFGLFGGRLFGFRVPGQD